MTIYDLIPEETVNEAFAGINLGLDPRSTIEVTLKHLEGGIDTPIEALRACEVLNLATKLPQGNDNYVITETGNLYLDLLNGFKADSDQSQ